MTHSQRVMLVDDDWDTNNIHQILLKMVDPDVEILDFLDARKAFAFLEQETGPVDLLLLDINMPTLNGWEFIHKYASLDPVKREHTKVVMVTASLSKKDQEQAAKNDHIKRYLNKPVTLDIARELLGMAG